MAALDEAALKDALARLPGAVVVVSARDDRGFRGLTASSFAAASLDPPLVLVCLDRHAATRDAVASGGAFNASLLAREHEFLADRFAGRAPMVDPLWRQVPHRVADNGLPVVTGSAAWFCCRLQSIHRAGDHDIAVGLVTEAGVGEAEPLVHWQRSFWSLTQ